MAKRLGVTTTTLRNWDPSGKLPAKRTISNQRYYTKNNYLKAINAKPQNSGNRCLMTLWITRLAQFILLIQIDLSELIWSGLNRCVKSLEQR
ncbi:MerR family DNA-binding transcriptional regulator [Levilactobacillus namurensis]|uniref:MerR family DNA-binding transcriptional regulator n=2 Tax=Levilactobacillus namurensis TaxID=380393 RepID=A0AAW8W7K0_9LACO|nr:MerR family DNA-binding transcriptional regulator [Levilactobacillus namurensis]MDT7014865.1 MerR family DNA-binding transcriptional regulator [Levilactobacillus namurensis]